LFFAPQRNPIASRQSLKRIGGTSIIEMQGDRIDLRPFWFSHVRSHAHGDSEIDGTIQTA
jgi:hypothetical protein